MATFYLFSFARIVAVLSFVLVLLTQNMPLENYLFHLLVTGYWLLNFCLAIKMRNSLEIVKVYGFSSEEISNICFMKEFSRCSSYLWLMASLANTAVAERFELSMKFV